MTFDDLKLEILRLVQDKGRIRISDLGTDTSPAKKTAAYIICAL